MRRAVEKLGKVGRRVYGKNRYGQTEYALVIPANPRTAPQQANRRGFGDTGPGYGRLTEAERALWEADGAKHRTHGRPGPSAPMTGFQRYMSVNAPRVRAGLAPLRVPPVESAPLPSAICHLPPAPASVAPPEPSPRPMPCRVVLTGDFRLQTGARHHPSPPMHYRTTTVATRYQHACSPFGPGRRLHRPLVQARAGPGPPPRLTSTPRKGLPRTETLGVEV